MGKKTGGRMKRLLNIFYHRKLRNSRYLGRVGLIAGFVLMMTLMLSRSYTPQFQYTVGEPWRDATLIAPFNFSIYKHPDTLEAEKQTLLAQLIPIFKQDSLREVEVKRKINQQIAFLQENLNRYQGAVNKSDTLMIERLNQDFFLPSFNLPANRLQKVEILGKPEQFTRLVIRLVDSAYNPGLLSTKGPDSIGAYIALRITPTQQKIVPVNKYIKEAAISNMLAQRFVQYDSDLRQILMRLLDKQLAPNIVYSETLTEAEKERLLAQILPVRGKIQKGTPIIRRGDIVDPETDKVLQSLQLELKKRLYNKDRWSVFVSEAMVILLITFILLLYLGGNKAKIYYSNQKLALIFSLFLLSVGSLVLAAKISDFALRVNDTFGSNLNLSYFYVAPASILAIFISNFFDARTGFLCNILLALFGAMLVQQSLEFAFVQIIAGTVAVYSLRRLRKRKTFFSTLGFTLLAYVTAYLSFSFFIKSSIQAIEYSNLVLFGINVALTVLSFNFIYPFERIFGVTSDLTYLELLDTNHPLLKKLARKASGTFQHSLQVANLAETAVNVIGGNALLVHVGALFHDIGKMKHPQYFIENMPSDKISPHEQIEYKRSAEIIIGHVEEGIQLAQKYRLPNEVIDFIRTHHGTTRVEYFYRMYLKDNPCENGNEEDCFRYKGPLPYSKETAVLMIADSIEAASRALNKPTPQDIKDLVNNIIDYKISDGQLSDANLTFKEITEIRGVIYKQLISMNHARLRYPDEMPKVMD